MSDFEKVMFRASADPAQFTPRGDNYEEPIYQWQVRAILIAMRALPVEDRMEAMGMAQLGWFCGTSLEDSIGDASFDFENLGEYEAGTVIIHSGAGEEGADLPVPVRSVWVEQDQW